MKFENMNIGKNKNLILQKKIPMLHNILSQLKSTVDRFIKIEITQVNIYKSYNNLCRENSEKGKHFLRSTSLSI